MSQIRKQSKSPYTLLWESGVLATFMLNDGCELTKNHSQTIFEPLLDLNEAKRLRQNDVSKPRAFSVLEQQHFPW